MEQSLKTTLDLRIVLVGKTGSGKSASGNTVLNKDEFIVMKSLDSVTTSCKKENVNVDGRLISVIDTPGMFDTSLTEENLKSEIERCVEMSVPGPHVFLLVIRLDVRFTDEEKNAVRWIQENFGQDAVKYTIILFTHADALGNKTLDEYIGKCNNIQSLIQNCNRRYHSFNNNRRSPDQVSILLNMIDEMVKTNEGEHYTNEMYKKAQRKMKIAKCKETAIEIGKTVLVGVAGVGAGAAAAAVILRDTEAAGERSVKGAAAAVAIAAEKSIAGAAAAVSIAAEESIAGAAAPV